MIKSFLKDTLIYGLSVTIAKLLLFISVPIFTRLMSVESYGIVSFIGSLIGLIAIIMKIGTNNAVQRYYFDVEDTLKTNVISSGLKVLFIFSSLGLIVSLIFAKVFEGYFSVKNISLVVLYSSLLYIFFLQYIVFMKDIMRLYFKPWVYFTLEVSPILLSVLLALLFVSYFNLNVEGYFLGYAVGTFFVLIVSFAALKNKLYFKEKTKFKKELIVFGYPFIFVGLASWIFQSADRWMLLELTNAKEVGLYSVAYQISSILLLFVTTFGIVWGPYAIKLLKDKLHKEVYSSVGTIWYLMITYIAFIISLFFNNIVQLLLDERYLPSIETGILLVVTIIFIGTVQISVLGMSIAKKTRVLPILTWGVACLNIVLNYFLIPEYSAFGAAIATLISNFFLTLLYFKYSQKFYYIPYSKIKFIIITAMIVFFYIFLFLTNLIYSAIIYKVLLLLFLSVFFIVWILYEYKKLMQLVGLNEK